MVHDTLVPPVSRVEQCCLALTTALLVFAGVAALVTPASGTGSAAGAAGETTGSLRALTAARTLPPPTKDGRVLVRIADTGFLGVVLDAANPTLLHVVVAHGVRAVDCNVVQPRVTVTEQSASAVRLVVSGYEYVPRGSVRSGHGGTTCVRAGSAAVPVLLQAPLGERHLFAGSAPEATTVADPTDFPQIRSLPAGYVPSTVQPVSATTPGFVARRSYRDGAAQLALRIGSRAEVVAPGRQLATASVGQHYAVVSGTGSTRCVTWNEYSGRVRQVCSSIVPGSGSTGDGAPLSTDQLLTAAGSLSGGTA